MSNVVLIPLNSGLHLICGFGIILSNHVVKERVSGFDMHSYRNLLDQSD